MFISGKWYEIRLPYGKKFTAQYLVENSGTLNEWFNFTDGSRKLVKDIVSFAEEIVSVDEPVQKLGIIDFLDDEDEI